LYYITCVCPSILGPAIAGKIYEHFHSYNIAFILGGVTCVVGSGIEAFSFILDSNCMKKSLFNKN
jgi:MFS family permease